MVDNLRLSITDQCNLRCIYCAPLTQQDTFLQQELLTIDEIVRLVGIFVKLGINKIKITGGEPLIIKNISETIKRIKDISGVKEISLTTNGIHLSQQVKKLKAAGLNRINISINSLQKKQYFKITKVDCLDSVLEGLRTSLSAGFDLIKVNFIPMRNINEHEIINFVNLSIKNSLIVRFIELFLTNESSKKCFELMIPSDEIKKIINTHYDGLKDVSNIVGDGPAHYFNIKNTEGVVGFINNSTENFCDSCTRLRMNASGQILPCLFSYPVCNVRDMIRQGKEDNEILDKLYKTVKMKAMFNKRTNYRDNVEMCKVGG